MRQSGANRSLASNSLIIRENTGNIFDIDPELKSARPEAAAVTYAFSGFP
jgi:hypothetical protein